MATQAFARLLVSDSGLDWLDTAPPRFQGLANFLQQARPGVNLAETKIDRGGLWRDWEALLLLKIPTSSPQIKILRPPSNVSVSSSSSNKLEPKCPTPLWKFKVMMVLFQSEESVCEKIVLPSKFVSSRSYLCCDVLDTFSKLSPSLTLLYGQ